MPIPQGDYHPRHRFKSWFNDQGYPLRQETYELEQCDRGLQAREVVVDFFRNIDERRIKLKKEVEMKAQIAFCQYDLLDKSGDLQDALDQYEHWVKAANEDSSITPGIIIERSAIGELSDEFFADPRALYGNDLFGQVIDQLKLKERDPFTIGELVDFIVDLKMKELKSARLN